VETILEAGGPGAETHDMDVDGTEVATGKMDVSKARVDGCVLVYWNFWRDDISG
jgi:hypothetical protein